jgi:hypothetical protein
MKSLSIFVAACALLAAANPANAWGDLGHKVTALIAYRHLTPVAKIKVDAMLAGDADTLTAPDFASRATWADKYRNSHRETAAWHYVNVEIDHPDLESACFGFPAPDAGRVASAGRARDCIVNKIEEFEAELQSSSTTPAERLMALKFLMHLVGDLHQPLHVADHDDRGGNCIGLSPSPDGHDTNLHAYWDTGVVEALGGTGDTIADRLDRRIAPSELSAWAHGVPKEWAMESFELRKDVYALPSRPTCNDRGTVALTPAYMTTAVQDSELQLEKAGVRMAVLLNRALGT